MPPRFTFLENRGVVCDPGDGGFREAPAPARPPEGHDLLLQVAAVAVNPVDLKQRARLRPGAEPRRLGYEAVGRVLAVGAEASGFAPGDRVWYTSPLERDGANGACQLVDCRLVARAPGNLDDADAAALPLTGLTAWQALSERLGLDPAGGPQPGRLLVVNGAGGVGSAAVQMAAALGMSVTATASRPESAEWCRRMGAAEVVEHRALDTLPEAGFDRILVAHEATALPDLARLVAPRGLICSVVNLAGPQDLAPLFAKAAGLVFACVFARSTFGLPDLAAQGAALARLTALVEAGRLRSTRTRTLRGLSPETVAEAHAAIASGRQLGKLVLTL